MPNILLLMMKNNQDMLLRLLLNLREQELDLQVHSMSLFYHLLEPTNTELYGSSTFTVEFNPEVRLSRSSSMLFCAAMPHHPTFYSGQWQCMRFNLNLWCNGHQR